MIFGENVCQWTFECIVSVLRCTWKINTKNYCYEFLLWLNIPRRSFIPHNTTNTHTHSVFLLCSFCKSITESICIVNAEKWLLFRLNYWCHETWSSNCLTARWKLYTMHLPTHDSATMCALCMLDTNLQFCICFWVVFYLG